MTGFAAELSPGAKFHANVGIDRSSLRQLDLLRWADGKSPITIQISAVLMHVHEIFMATGGKDGSREHESGADKKGSETCN